MQTIIKRFGLDKDYFLMTNAELECENCNSLKKKITEKDDKIKELTDSNISLLRQTIKILESKKQ